jgi:hypothetical protein
MPFNRGQYGLNASHRVAFVKLTHVHIQCKDEEGNPMAGRPYTIVLPRGGEVQGELDDQGWAKHEDIYPGEVVFHLHREEEPLVPVDQEEDQVYHLRLRFEDEDGDPFVNKPFQLEAGDVLSSWPTSRAPPRTARSRSGSTRTSPASPTVGLSASPTWPARTVAVELGG